MIDSDGSFSYSKVVAIRNGINNSFQILRNPVSTMLTLTHLTGGWVELMNIQGKVLQKLMVKNQTLHLDVASLSAGIYLVNDNCFGLY
jgi:hypothetical protein